MSRQCFRNACQGAKVGNLNNKLVVTGFAADPAKRNPCARQGCTGHGTQGVTAVAPEAAAEGDL